MTHFDTKGRRQTGILRSVPEPRLLGGRGQVTTSEIDGHCLELTFAAGNIVYPRRKIDAHLESFQIRSDGVAGATIYLALSSIPEEIESGVEDAMQNARTLNQGLELIEHMRHALFDHPSIPKRVSDGVYKNLTRLAVSHVRHAFSVDNWGGFRFDHPSVVPELLPVLDAYYAEGISGPYPRLYEQFDDKIMYEPRPAAAIVQN